jgi:phosphatidylglycerol---prolipoprotein diacylglyceryl transferase
MFPTLFRIGPLEVGSHDAFVVLGAFCATVVFAREAVRRRMLDERVVWIAIGSLVCGALAAKASTAWRYVAEAPELSLAGVLLYGGKSVLGGLAGAYAGAVLTKRIVGYRCSTGDLFAPAVALGMGVGRVGCLLTEQIGTPTALPWGVAVSAETAASMPMCPTCAPGVPMHPSFAYEIAFHAVAFAALLWLRPRVPVRGELFKVYLLAYGLFRFAVEFVRGNPPVWHGLSYSQLFLIPTTLVLVAYFARQLARDAYAVPPFAVAPPVQEHACTTNNSSRESARI